MLTSYIQAAMRRAHYELLEDQPSDPFYGSIPGLQGVLAIGRTLEECREELQSVLEDWIIFRLSRNLIVPAIDNWDLQQVLPLQEAA